MAENFDSVPHVSGASRCPASSSILTKRISGKLFPDCDPGPKASLGSQRGAASKEPNERNESHGAERF